MLAYGCGIGNDILYILLFQSHYNIRNFALVCIGIKQNNCVVLWKNIGNRILFGKRIDGFCAGLQIARGDKQHNEQYRNNTAETVAETAQRRRKTFLMRFFRPFFLICLFNEFM